MCTRWLTVQRTSGSSKWVLLFSKPQKLRCSPWCPFQTTKKGYPQSKNKPTFLLVCEIGIWFLLLWQAWVPDINRMGRVPAIKSGSPPPTDMEADLSGAWLGPFVFFKGHPVRFRCTPLGMAKIRTMVAAPYQKMNQNQTKEEEPKNGEVHVHWWEGTRNQLPPNHPRARLQKLLLLLQRLKSAPE